MKTISTLILICFAQVAFAQKSFFGADAGINVANVRELYRNTFPQQILYTNNTVRANFGFFYQRVLVKDLSLRVGAQYMGMGDQHNDYTPKTKFRIDYITIPLSAHYSANKHLTLNGGGYVSFTIGGTRINNQDITKTYHKNDFGIFFGGEHDVYKNFALGVKYIFGLKNILLPDNNGQIKYTNRALQFTLIYKFKKTS